MPSLIPIDLPGHGQAPPPRDVGFLAACREVTARVPAEVRSLVGYSMGGRVALGMVAADPGRFDVAVVLGAHLGPRDAGERSRNLAQERGLAGALDEGMSSLVDRFESLPLFASQAKLPASVLAAQRAARLSHAPDAIRQTMAALATSQMPDLRDSLRATSTRVIFVAGELDEKYVALAREGATLAPRHACEIVPGVGHNIVLEAVAAVARIIASVDSPTH